MILVVSETSRRCGRFDGFINGEQIVASSHQPMFDAARELLRRGAMPQDRIVMRHAGSSVDSLKSMVGDAARLAVEETGGAPQYRVWRAFPSRTT